MPNLRRIRGCDRYSHKYVASPCRAGLAGTPSRTRTASACALRSGYTSLVSARPPWLSACPLIGFHSLMAVDSLAASVWHMDSGSWDPSQCDYSHRMVPVYCMTEPGRKDLRYNGPLSRPHMHRFRWCTDPRSRGIQ